MVRNCCNTESACCNNFNDYENDLSPIASSCYTFLVILFLFFGGGLSQGSFWGAHSNIYSCSGFNTTQCNNFGFSTFNNNLLNTNNFSGNRPSTTNFLGFHNANF